MYYPKFERGISASKYFLFIILLGYLFAVSCKQPHNPMKIVSEDAMVQNFYANNDSNHILVFVEQK